MLPSNWENLSRCSPKLIHVCRKATCIANILSKNIIYIYYVFQKLKVASLRYQFLYQILHGYVAKSWTHRLDPPYCEISKMRNTDLQFRSPRYVYMLHVHVTCMRQVNIVIILIVAFRLVKNILKCIDILSEQLSLISFYFSF